MVLQPQFAGDENFLSGNAAVLYRPAYIRFIKVRGCRINVPVSGLEGGQHRIVGRPVIGNREHAESDCRDFVAVV